MPLFTSAVLSIFTAGCQACTVRLCSSLRQYISSRVRGAVTPAWNLGCPFSGEAALKLSDLTSLCASWGRGSLPPVRAGQPFDLDAFLAWYRAHPDVSSAPTYELRARVRQLRCVACHQVDGAGPTATLAEATPSLTGRCRGPSASRGWTAWSQPCGRGRPRL